MKTQARNQAECVAALLNFTLSMRRYKTVSGKDRPHVLYLTDESIGLAIIFTPGKPSKLYREAVEWMQKKRYHEHA